MEFKTVHLPMTSPDKLQRAEWQNLSHAELLQAFLGLPAPDIAEMNGEYPAQLLAQPNAWAQLIGQFSVNNPVMPGRWLCKAFRPVSDHEGRGYNTFSQVGRKVQRFPMRTLIAPSRFDGRPAYTLVYAAYHSMCGRIHMVDELRRIRAGLYLGLGTWGWSDAHRRIALPFLLQGPSQPYDRDIGQAVKGFDIRGELPHPPSLIQTP